MKIYCRGQVNINRKSWKKAEYKNMSFGRDTNFNNSSDAERLHAIGVCSNNLQVADFRVIANKSMINDWKNICHIQNHREQFGDLPKIMHTAFAPDLADEAQIDFSESEHNNNFSSLHDDLSFAQNENNSFDSREDVLKKISDENSIDLQFLNEQIFEQNEMQNIDYLRILEMNELKEISKLEYISKINFDSEFILISKSSNELVRARYGSLGDFISIKSRTR